MRPNTTKTMGPRSASGIGKVMAMNASPPTLMLFAANLLNTPMSIDHGVKP